MAEPLLDIRSMSTGYGQGTVLHDVSFSLPAGGSLALLGRNGVGKTTLILALMGFLEVPEGTILLRGEDISRLAPHKRARLGLGWVPQERDVFPSLSVEENLTVTARAGHWDCARIYELFPRLKERRANMGNQLSGGEQQMLAIGRTLMTNPHVLLLDEPMEGLAPIIVEELASGIRRMGREDGMTLLLVEQHAELALGLTDRAVVIERGTIAYRAASRDLLDDHPALDRLVGMNLSVG